MFCLSFEAFTRFDIADLARRGHAIADGESSESPAEWVLRYREARSALATMRDVEMLNRFATEADGDDESDDAIDATWASRMPLARPSTDSPERARPFP